MHYSLVVVAVCTFFSQGLCSCSILSTHRPILDFFPETFTVTCLFKTGAEAVVPLGFSCLSGLQIDILLGHFREQVMPHSNKALIFSASFLLSFHFHATAAISLLPWPHPGLSIIIPLISISEMLDLVPLPNHNLQSFYVSIHKTIPESCPRIQYQVASLTSSTFFPVQPGPQGKMLQT